MNPLKNRIKIKTSSSLLKREHRKQILTLLVTCFHRINYPTATTVEH